MQQTDILWRVKLAARLHDPGEKALVLLRDPAGHEGGTVRALKGILDLDCEPPEFGAVRNGHVLFRNGWQQGLDTIVRRADWWASAADRPQWPTQVQCRWTQQPVLIHPLSGEALELPTLAATGIGDIKERSFAHFAHLRDKVSTPDGPDYRKLLLAFWRFGPALVEEKDAGKLGELWRLLPADTRVPDHSIWEHLDLVSAFAGAFAADPNGEAALLALSIGPVQPFIEAARKMDDLWAGSHLLAYLSWEAMRPLAERLGPDAIIFPRLRGVPLVDVWLVREQGLPMELFHQEPWRKEAPDANPLFGASLPNRFVAIVPASQACEIAAACREHVRQTALELGVETVDLLLEKAGLKEEGSSRDESIPAYQQVREQLRDFPEVHWAGVPFRLAKPGDVEKQTDLDVSGLEDAMVPFFGNGKPGFLGSPAWSVLSKEIDWPGEAKVEFYKPNPGVLYPAFYELNERLLAAAKSVRPFSQSRQEGWRCSLTGEAEWLTHDRALLKLPPRQRSAASSETLWTRLAKRCPGWAREGEHLSAIPAIKRVWPTLFVKKYSKETNGRLQRFVVSTHTMALAYQLAGWLKRGGGPDEGLLREFRQARAEPVALPRKLLSHAKDDELREFVKLVPGYLDAVREAGDEAEEDRGRYAQARKRIAKFLSAGLQQGEQVQLETYYALVLMDGDRMGAILSGDEKAGMGTFLESFHPVVRQAFEEAARQVIKLKDYGSQRRPPSPGRHMGISGALNDFSQVIVPHIVEDEHHGRLLYSGGDDVMAMLPVADVLAAIARLRAAYRGEGKDEDQVRGLRRSGRLSLAKGYAFLDGRLMRTMGPRATVSCGVVVAHHMAPLGFVLRELRDAERSAKNYRRCRNGSLVDRDAFHIRIIKRSGSTVGLSADWGEPIDLLTDMRDFLKRPEVSRRAVYNTLEWLRELPEPDSGDEEKMLEALLSYQLARQAKKPADELAPGLASRLVKLALGQNKKGERRVWLERFLTVAEFLARETRVEAGNE